MAETRTPRELATREKTQRRWRPASVLPEPTPEPGMGYRWVMTHLVGESQPTNVSQRLREGYEPVKAEDHPELAYEANAKTGNIEVGGLMLCKMPQEMLDERTAFYANMTNSQASSVNSKFTSQSDPRMPLFSEQKSSTSRGSFGNGS
jgi:hypothetical protein